DDRHVRESLPSVARSIVILRGLTITTSRKDNTYIVSYGSSCKSTNDYNKFYCYHGAIQQAFGSQEMRKELDHYGNYTQLQLQQEKNSFGVNYDETYSKTPKNSLILFEINPFYTGPIRAARSTIWLNANNVPDHGWIVTETGRCYPGYVFPSYSNKKGCKWSQLVEDWKDYLLDYRKGWPSDQRQTKAEAYQLQQKIGQMKASYKQVLATGKVRLFYGLDQSQSKRFSWHLDCEDFEEYCIGIPHPHSSGQAHIYGFGLYLMAWERMPAATHISRVFKIGDDCTTDLGTPGPDADTGLGRLDIGCVIEEVYKANVNPLTTVLSVAARTPSARKQKKSFLNEVARAADVNKEFTRLELMKTTSRKQSAYLINYRPCADMADNHPSIFYCVHSINRQILYKNHHRNLQTMDHQGYTRLHLADNGAYRVNYDESYQQSSENSLVGFEINPFYTGPINLATTAIWLDADNITEHGWIVTETGACYSPKLFAGCNWQHLLNSGMESYVDHRKQMPGEQSQQMIAKLAQMRTNYQQAAATGKVRLFYGLDARQQNHDRRALNCQGFEEYCIGLPHPYPDPNSTNASKIQTMDYGFGLYLMAWERMPAATHISAVFKIGDDCTEDLGTPGADSSTGLGRLDIGCVAYKVYQASLNPAAATLSVAARLPSSTTQASVTLAISSQVQAQSASSLYNANRQQFFDDFAQELFSDLGSLSLPGNTDASVEAGF
ncbi:MAG: hypothetical protein OXC81_04850, partial [Betaproteobacteria bacterium]|nr:hypothetical protein [Betaproteobacteria bacterium]